MKKPRKRKENRQGLIVGTIAVILVLGMVFYFAVPEAIFSDIVLSKCNSPSVGVLDCEGSSNKGSVDGVLRIDVEIDNSVVDSYEFYKDLIIRDGGSQANDFFNTYNQNCIKDSSNYAPIIGGPSFPIAVPLFIATDGWANRDELESLNLGFQGFESVADYCGSDPKGYRFNPFLLVDRLLDQQIIITGTDSQGNSFTTIGVCSFSGRIGSCQIPDPPNVGVDELLTVDSVTVNMKLDGFEDTGCQSNFDCPIEIITEKFCEDDSLKDRTTYSDCISNVCQLDVNNPDITIVEDCEFTCGEDDNGLLKCLPEDGDTSVDDNQTNDGDGTTAETIECWSEIGIVQQSLFGNDGCEKNNVTSTTCDNTKGNYLTKEVCEENIGDKPFNFVLWGLIGGGVLVLIVVLVLIYLNVIKRRKGKR